MHSFATLRRALVAACFVGLAGLPAGTRATAESGGEVRRVPLQTPGTAFRQKNPISADSVGALQVIMRTENIEDPMYLSLRRVVSDQVAEKMSLDADALHAAWSRSSRAHQIAMLSALTQLDVPYVVGKEDPYIQMDCSGLLWYAWRAAGVDMPRQAVSQLDKRMRVERKDAVAGDVVGEGTHVHIYLGLERAMVHAPFNGKSVRLKTMSEEQYNRVAWARPTNIATYRL